MTETRFFGLSGGLDLVTPAINVPAGRVVSGLNYESSPRGYKRIDGYERYDGRPKPSEAIYHTLRYTGREIPIQEGEVINGIWSGAQAVALDVAAQVGDYFIVPVHQITGTFLNAEDISVEGVPGGTIVGVLAQSGAPDLQLNAKWHLKAMDIRRALIQKVPGSGPIRGVWLYNNTLYAFRDNEAQDTCLMYRSTSSGWQVIQPSLAIWFHNGQGAEPIDNETVLNAVSNGATLLVLRTILKDGHWTTNDASGYFIVQTVSGVWTSPSTAITWTSGGSAAALSLPTFFRFPPGGKYDFVNHNFYATSETQRMYGCNGVGVGFEYDGTLRIPIETGAPNDKPIRVAAHKGHLFFAYPGGILQHSATLNPTSWEYVLGANQIGIGEEITDLVASAAGELAVFGRNKVAVLYGENAQNFNLVTLSDNSGSVPWTAEMIGSPIYMDEIGVRSLDTTQAFGNFALGTRTQLVQPMFEKRQRGGINAVESVRIRSRDMYRLFFEDGSALSIYFGRNPSECMPFNLGVVPTATCAGDGPDGYEQVFFGDKDGWVYQMDSGSSFDGKPIYAFIRLPFNHVGSPAQWKRWHKAVIEIDAPPRTDIKVIASVAYGNPDYVHGEEQTFDLYGGGGFWNEAIWNEFHWSTQVEGMAETYIDAIGQNLSLVIASEQAYSQPHVLHGVTLHFNYRRLMR